jgi:hypothetical protein
MMYKEKYKIYEWKEIENIFRNSCILLGNGSSIAVYEKFSYCSLKDTLKNLSLSKEEEYLFEYFNTNDFEQILKIIWQANNVNKILNVQDTKTREAYYKIRNALIEAVKEIHPKYSEIENNFLYISNFLKNFKIIVSLNYDLIIYWAMLYGNEKLPYKFVDGFISGNFDENYLRQRNNIKVFYPHGNLILAFDKLLNEIKLKVKNDNLILSITEEWESEEYIPLFISEGTSKQKINSIKRSNYLNTIYETILPRMHGFSLDNSYLYEISESPSYIIGNSYHPMRYKTLVIYGFAFGEQDEHIIEKIFNRYNHNIFIINCVAISVFNYNERDCDNAINKLKKYNKYLHIYFFDSKSSGCWNNP